MNKSSLLLFESKWNKFLKESNIPKGNDNKNPSHSIVKKKEDDYEIDDILKSMGFSDEEEEEDNNDILENNVELMVRRFVYTFAKKGLRELYRVGELNNTPLAKNSLQKFLGSGSYAVAFEDQDGHVIKCGEVRSENTTDKAFYKRYLKKPSKNFIVHYYKTFRTSDGFEMYLAITNKFMTFYEYAHFKIGSIKNEKTPDIGKHGYPNFLIELTTEIDIIRKQLNPSAKLTFPSIYKILSEKYPRTISRFYLLLKHVYGLTPGNSYKILTEIIKVYCAQSKPDLSLNNLGVNIVSGMDSPGFFFFDQ